MALDPIYQFKIKDYFSLVEIGESKIAFTNSALFMIVAVGSILAFVLLGSSKRALVPGRFQSMVEMSYEMVAGMIRSTAGQDGMRFFPLVFSLFMFVLFCNLLGMFPYFFTVTSHIIITGSLALLVIGTVLVYGLMRHGLSFFKLFAPSGIPLPILILLVPIEVISFLSRPISLSVRLFANMVAGHIALKIFAGFIISLGSLGFAGVLGAVMPFAVTTALTAFEFLVAFLQAYIFAILTCIYLNDALHPHH